MDSHKKRNLVKNSDWSNRVDNWVVAEKRNYGGQLIEVCSNPIKYNIFFDSRLGII